MKKILTLTLAATLALGGLTACASTKPDFGDEVSDVAKDWRKGEKRVEEGEALIKTAKSDMRTGERDLEKAKSSIERWQTQSTVDRQAYRSAFDLTGTAENATEVTAEADALKRLKKSAEKSESELKEARQRKSKAEARISSAKSKREKGEAMIADGNKIMKRAERNYKSVIK